MSCAAPVGVSHPHPGTMLIAFQNGVKTGGGRHRSKLVLGGRLTREREACPIVGNHSAVVLTRNNKADHLIARHAKAMTPPPSISRPAPPWLDLLEPTTLEPEKAHDKIVLVGYGEMSHFWTGVMELQYHFRLGRIFAYEGNEPAERRQFAIKELSGKGIWQSKDPPIKCFKPDAKVGAESGEALPCWFRCLELHPWDGIELTNTATGKTLRPEYLGLRLMVREVVSRDEYAWYREQYFEPQEIFGLLKFAWLNEKKNEPVAARKPRPRKKRKGRG